MNDFFRRTWAEIDLDAVAHNYHQIKDRLNPGTKVCCVIKADAYGHGAELLAREYEELGADWFAVSNLEEAIQLRNAQISLPDFGVYAAGVGSGTGPYGCGAGGAFP